MNVLELGDLDLERREYEVALREKELDLERKRLELDRTRFELMQRRLEMGARMMEVAARLVSMLYPEASDDARPMLAQSLVPPLLQFSELAARGELTPGTTPTAGQA